MGDLSDPSTRIPAAAGRASSIYGDRVREEQLTESLADPRRHRCSCTSARACPRSGSPRSGPTASRSRETTQLGTIDYGIEPRVQNLLAAVRTDLDSFSQVEAYSLSLEAYLMTSRELPEQPKLAYEWLPGRRVAALEAQLHEPGPEYLKQLAVARKRFRKASALDGTMKALERVSAVAALVVAGLLAYAVFEAVPDEVPTWSLLVAFVVPAVLVTLYLRSKFPLKVIYRFADWLYTWLLPTIAAVPLWLSAHVTLWVLGTRHGDPRHVEQEARVDAVVAGLDALATEHAGIRPLAGSFRPVAVAHDVNDPGDHSARLGIPDIRRAGDRAGLKALAALRAGVRHRRDAGREGRFESACHGSMIAKEVAWTSFSIRLAGNRERRNRPSSCGDVH